MTSSMRKTTMTTTQGKYEESATISSSQGPWSRSKKTIISSSLVHRRGYGSVYPSLMDSVADERDEQHCPASPKSTSSATTTSTTTTTTTAASSSGTDLALEEDESLGEFDRIYNLSELKERHPVLFKWAWHDGNPHSCLLRLLEFEEEGEFKMQLMTSRRV